MNIKIKLDPKAFGKSGYLALCPYCLKTTEYFICCDEYKLNIVDHETIDELIECYDLNQEQAAQLYADFDEWEQSQPDLFEIMLDAYRAWCSTGKDNNQMDKYDVWDASVTAYAKRYGIYRGAAINLCYRTIEAELRDERVK